MGFMNDFEAGVNKTAKVMGDIARKAVDESKKQIKIQKVKSEINSEFKELGKVVYDIHMNHKNAEDTVEIERICSNIQEKLEILNSIQEDEIKYSEEIDRRMKKPEKDQDGVVLMKFCKNCNIGNHPDSTHCISCGRKFE